MITDIKNVNTKTDEGKLLVAAIAKITTESQRDKMPNEVLDQLNELAKEIPFEQNTTKSKNRIIDLFVEYLPEDYKSDTNASLTIRCKKSESAKIEYDIACVLHDAAVSHPFFVGTQIIDRRLK